MKFSDAIEDYMRDMRAAGRINTRRTEDSYREVLDLHADDVHNRDPRLTNREDIKKTLRRWTHPNTQAGRRAVLVSFYDWTVEEMEPPRPNNPARQTRRPRRREAHVVRPTRQDATELLDAARGTLERRAIFIGICAGPRSYELRHLQAHHFRRDGFLWISPDIGKGGRERWIPIIAELSPIVDEIRATTGPGEYVLHGQTRANPPRAIPDRPMGATTLFKLVRKVGRRAGIHEELSPHCMRRAFADYIARSVGIYMAQELLGHADISTTRGYTDKPTLDELREAVQELKIRPAGLPPRGRPASPTVETVGIEPTSATA
jgi:integrase